MNEIYLRLAPRFVQRWADPVIPFANETGCRLHDVKHLQRGRLTLVNARRAASRLL
jgi:hypothetical protein